MKQRQPRDPYSGTQVSTTKSQEGIRKMLLENGAQGFQFTEMLAEQTVELKWARGVILDGQKVLQPLRVRISYRGRRIESVYRAMFYHLKTKFEVIRFGIVSFEEEFLPYFLTKLPGGQEVTVAERLLPSLRRGALPSVLDPLALSAGEDDR